MRWTCAVAAAAMAVVLAPSMARADSVTAVENARAKERQGAYLSRQDRELLRRYGSNDDYGRYDYGPYYGPYYYGDGYYADEYDYGPSVEFGYYRD